MRKSGWANYNGYDSTSALSVGRTLHSEVVWSESASGYDKRLGPSASMEAIDQPGGWVRTRC